jgi:hypothetical protein
VLYNYQNFSANVVILNPALTLKTSFRRDNYVRRNYGEHDQQNVDVGNPGHAKLFENTHGVIV